MRTTDSYELEWSKPNPDDMLKILVEKHEFSKERVQKVIEKLSKGQDQKGLGDFF